MSLILVSGRSGSGKSVAIKALEDNGYFCVDNLPVSLLPDLISKVHGAHPDIAVAIDARNAAEELAQFEHTFNEISEQFQRPKIIFIDADEATLLKRYSETRRRHPLTEEGLSLNEAIAQERDRISPIAMRADLLIDTTTMAASALRELIYTRVLQHHKAGIDLMFESFGFKNGVPNDADYVFDARCLPNPYWDSNLRPYSGKDEPVQKFFEEQDRVAEFIWQIRVFLETWLPRFEQDNRSYLTVAIGCTGGQHRSVYVSEQLAAFFRESYPQTQIRHRDMRAYT